ncbi:unnamed protein product [Plutella xylostella]|uniref:RNA exonuclease 4 n=1 Tax=Plutella xylostella TaxID=51655 RepID=A0A8S4EWZ8_PLUXY|nr:unnamed protein product [Plutella xylostella]
MTNGLRTVAYILLDLTNFLLYIILKPFQIILLLLQVACIQLFHVITMTESSKKRKRSDNDQTSLTVANRGGINANWQRFLASNLIMDKKNEKPAQEVSKDHYTGTFRRSRKKKANNNITSNSVQNNMKTLNITPDSKTEPEVNKTEKKDNNNKTRVTKFVAMDCEMVGIGYNGDDHMLARVSLVNKFGDCIYDKFVKAREEVKDYRTDVSGIRREDLLNGEEFSTVQKEVSELIRGKILVGHSLKNDLSVLFLSHPKRSIRDTSKYKPFRKITKGSTPSLKRLAKEILSIDIQSGEHSSVEDARAAMQLYCTVAKNWEAGLSDKRGHKRLSE